MGDCPHDVPVDRYDGLVLAGAWSRCWCCEQLCPTVHGMEPYRCKDCGGMTPSEHRAMCAGYSIDPGPGHLAEWAPTLRQRIAEHHASHCTAVPCPSPWHRPGRHTATRSTK